ncbi:MAG TPA: hypothetical protein VN285_05390 [Candidatus Deferrimicrobium sp.]|nr:hypothetical protein [Candidatus Deferrimicrobium sp.]
MFFDPAARGGKHRHPTLAALGLVIVCLAESCGGEPKEKSANSGKADTKWNRANAESEYQLLQMELNLAQAEQTYLVLDMKRESLKLKLQGVVVWSYPMQFAEPDSEKVREFYGRFADGESRGLRVLTGTYLFAAADKTPDSVLKIVGEVVRVDPQRLQRDMPARFQLHWEDGLVLEVRTDITGSPLSKFQNAVMEIKQVLQRPFGETTIILKMDPQQALTLYRAATRGMATLVYPPG